MIPQAAVNRFLAAPRDDLRRYKRMSDAELERAAAALPADPPIWGGLQREQRILFLAAAERRRVAGWLDTGLGKSYASIAIARYFRRAGVARRFLVLVPANINLAEWRAERDLRSPRTSMVVLSGSSRDKWEQVRAGAPTMTVATYGGLVRMVCTKVRAARGRRAGETVLKIDENLAGELAATFDGLVMDESSADQAVQYRSSLAWRVCRRLSRSAEVCVALSGTPFGRDPTPLWAQMFLVDGGEALGETLGLFRAAFFVESENEWGGREYTFREKMSPKLHSLLAHSSVTIEADESTLPDVVSRVRTITLPHEAEAYSERAREAILAAHGSYQETKNAFVRLRQISSGFLGYTDDETGDRAKFAFDENPKLESLMSRIQSVVGKHKVLVAHDFIYSGDRICEELDRLGIGHARVRSGKQRDVDDALRRIKGDDACRVLVLSNKLAQGPNLQVCRYLEVYESPVDPKSRKQLRRRVERQHSAHSKVFVTDYVVRGTYDSRILDALRSGENLFESIIRGRTST